MAGKLIYSDIKLHVLLCWAFAFLETWNLYITACIIRVLLYAFIFYVMREWLCGVTLDDLLRRLVV